MNTLKTKLSITVVLAGLLCTLVGVSTTRGSGPDAALQMAQKAVDVQEIQNVMSMHEWYHAALENDVEVEKLWAQKTPGDVFAVNSGYLKGLDSIKKTYGSLWQLKGPGIFLWHPINSPVIEVAGDRKTAKGVWQTTGLVGAYKGGKAEGAWLWEKYGVDFVNEDGKWKIWHMHVYTDVAIPVGGRMDAAGVDNSGEAEEALENEQDMRAGRAIQWVSHADVPKRNYYEWSPQTVPHMIPKPPEPYRTFSETTSYVDENEYK